MRKLRGRAAVAWNTQVIATAVELQIQPIGYNGWHIGMTQADIDNLDAFYEKRRTRKTKLT